MTTTGELTDRLERRLTRARQENEILERMIEDKTRSLYLARAEVERGKVFLENVLNSMQSAVMITDPAGAVTAVGGSTPSLLGAGEHELIGRHLGELLAISEPPDAPDPAAGVGSAVEGELVPLGDRAPIPVLVTTSPLEDENGEASGAVHVATDLRDRRRLEVELRHAQRLESIGQLAAGVAHEINTPIQFVSDSVRFLGEVLGDLMDLVESHQRLREAIGEPAELADLVADVDRRTNEAELGFVREEAPQALTRTVDGLDRVATIVKALKQFSHPGSDDMSPTDLGDIVENTLTVARNEYKYVAEIDRRLDDVGDVFCHPGDLGQVLLNLVVNAAHAISEHAEPGGELGRITVSTRRVDDGVLIEVTDTGGGVPAEIRDRVFEPFFTTKEPGHGTGQGLALAHNVIVNKHRGRLDLEVDDGVGSTFRIWLPGERSP